MSKVVIVMEDYDVEKKKFRTRVMLFGNSIVAKQYIDNWIAKESERKGYNWAQCNPEEMHDEYENAVAQFSGWADNEFNDLREFITVYVAEEEGASE